MKNNINTLLASYAMFGLFASAGVNSAERSSSKVSDKKYKIIPKGCAEYNCNGFLIIAISQKSAWKKYHKLLKHTEK